jgi:predicted nuclease with TOPRIM domain
MPLAQEDFQEIASFIRKNLADWLVEQSYGKPPPVYEIELRERIIRVEEELKNQRDLMRQGFELMEKRFEQIDKRFEQVDKRFEQVDKRFEQMEKRFENLGLRMDSFMRWSFGITLTVGGLVVAAIKYLP